MNYRKMAVSTVMAAVAAVVVGLGGGALAHATPHVDPVDALRAAGVPMDVAVFAANAAPVAGGVDTVNLAHPKGGFPGSQIDAVVDHAAQRVTVVQRWLETEPSQLQVGWVNLRTGTAGVSGLPDATPGTIDGQYPTIDRSGVLSTGAGPVAVVVFGRIPGWTGLIPLAPEYFGYLTPAAALLQV